MPLLYPFSSLPSETTTQSNHHGLSCSSQRPQMELLGAGSTASLLRRIASIRLCVSAVARAKEATVPNVITEVESASGWREIKKAVIGSQVVALERRTWQETEVRVAVAEPAAAKERWEEQGGVMYVPPLWQRRILMGEKCEVPKFSGLILYEERGRPLMSINNSNRATVQKEKPAAPVTTLKALH